MLDGRRVLRLGLEVRCPAGKNRYPAVKRVQSWIEESAQLARRFQVLVSGFDSWLEGGFWIQCPAEKMASDWNKVAHLLKHNSSKKDLPISHQGLTLANKDVSHLVWV